MVLENKLGITSAPELAEAEERIKKINNTMKEYLDKDIFTEYTDSMIYLERTQNDGKVRQKRNDDTRLGSAAVHAVSTCQNDDGQACVEDKGGCRAYAGHGQIRSALTGGQVIVDAAEVISFILCAGQGADHASAGHVLLHLAHHFVLAFLDMGEERHALLGGPDGDGGQKRQCGDEDQRQYGLQQE